jgi:hypothetical protein
MPAGVPHPPNHRRHAGAVVTVGPALSNGAPVHRFRPAAPYTPRARDPECWCCHCATHRYVEVGRGKALVWKPECAVCADGVDWRAR